MKSPAFSLGLMLSAVICLTVSCATSSGSAYSRSASGDQRGAALAAQSKQEDGAPDDDDDQADWETQAGASWSSGGLSVTIQSTAGPMGTVSVSGLPDGAELWVDGSFVAIAGESGQTSASVPAGERGVSIRAFGYEDWESVIWVPAFSLTELSVLMTAQAFSLDGPQTTLRFDPRRPAHLGKAVAVFSATAPGTALAELLCPDGSLLRELGFLIVEAELVSVSWDGRDTAGEIVPDGDYTIRLSGQGVSAEARVEVAELPMPAPSSLHGGFSGALLAPDASLLPEGIATQWSVGAYAFPESIGGETMARLAVWTGLRGAMGPKAEYSLSAMYIPYINYGESPSADSLGLGAGAKLVLSEKGAASLALYGRAALSFFLSEETASWPAPWDAQARFRGLGLGLTGQLASEAGALYASAELSASDFYPGWDDGQYPVPGFFSWLYLRLGLHQSLELGPSGRLTIGASCAVRTEPLGSSAWYELREPLSVGLEAAWTPKASAASVHAFAAGEWRAFSSWYLAGGLGLSMPL